MDSAVSRGLLILETLARSNGSMRLTDISRQTELQKSTVHRVLGTLIALGYATQNEETGLYQATLKVWELGSGILTAHPVKRAAAGFLHELHRLTGETVSLTIPSGDDVLYLDKIISPRPIRFTTRVGSRVPMPRSASGKAILAHLPDRREIAERVLPTLIPEKKYDVDQLMSELDLIPERGYAISSSRPGVESIASVVMNYDNRPIAAMSISAPTQRLNEEKRADVIEAVLAVCARLSDSIGKH